MHYGPRVISLNDIRGLHNFYFEILRPVAGYHFRRLWEDNRVRMKRKGEIGAKAREYQLLPEVILILSLSSCGQLPYWTCACSLGDFAGCFKKILVELFIFTSK